MGKMSTYPVSINECIYVYLDLSFIFLLIHLDQCPLVSIPFQPIPIQILDSA